MGRSYRYIWPFPEQLIRTLPLNPAFKEHNISPPLRPAADPREQSISLPLGPRPTPRGRLSPIGCRRLRSIGGLRECSISGAFIASIRISVRPVNGMLLILLCVPDLCRSCFVNTDHALSLEEILLLLLFYTVNVEIRIRSSLRI